METARIAGKVKSIIASVTGIPEANISDNALFKEDLGLDSLAILEVAVDVENSFHIRASDEELQQIRSIQDSIELILKHTCVQVVPSELDAAVA